MAVMWPIDVKIKADYGSFVWVYIWIIYGHYYTGFFDYSWLWPNVSLYLDIFGWFPIWWTWWKILCKKMKLDRLSQWNCTWTTPTCPTENEVYNLLSKCDESPSTRCSQLQWIIFQFWKSRGLVATNRCDVSSSTTNRNRPSCQTSW